jgi:hypothetical protein
MLPELKTLFDSLKARKRNGEDTTVSTNKDVYNYKKLVEALTWMQADVPVTDSYVVEKYKLVFGDTLSEKFQNFIREKLPQQESPSSQDHAASQPSSDSFPEQVCTLYQ